MYHGEEKAEMSATFFGKKNHLFYNQTHPKISYVTKRKQTPLNITLLNSLPYFITQKGT